MTLDQCLDIAREFKWPVWIMWVMWLVGFLTGLWTYHLTPLPKLAKKIRAARKAGESRDA